MNTSRGSALSGSSAIIQCSPLISSRSFVSKRPSGVTTTHLPSLNEIIWQSLWPVAASHSTADDPPSVRMKRPTGEKRADRTQLPFTIGLISPPVATPHKLMPYLPAANMDCPSGENSIFEVYEVIKRLISFPVATSHRRISSLVVVRTYLPSGE